MRSQDEMRRVRALAQRDLSSRQIAELTGVPLSTVVRWRSGGSATFGPAVERAPWRPVHPPSYAYLLGAYLGDGHITVGRPGKAWLRVFLDGTYPGIVDEVVTAITITSHWHKVQCYDGKESRVKIVQCAWKRWPEVFPQHGPGRKHERAIVLEPWQQEVADAHPDELVRGLIHSDGCRTVNRFRTKLPSGRIATYEYPRYFFSNLSPEIRQIFRDACALLGVRTTMSNARNVSVSHRRSVAILEELVGPKR